MTRCKRTGSNGIANILTHRAGSVVKSLMVAQIDGIMTFLAALKSVNAVGSSMSFRDLYEGEDDKSSLPFPVERWNLLSEAEVKSTF